MNADQTRNGQRARTVRIYFIRTASLVALATGTAFTIIAAYELLTANPWVSTHIATGVAFLALGWVIDLDLRIRRTLDTFAAAAAKIERLVAGATSHDPQP